MFMLIFQEKLHSILIKKIWHKKHISDPYDLHEPISDEQFVTNSNISSRPCFSIDGIFLSLISPVYSSQHRLHIY